MRSAMAGIPTMTSQRGPLSPVGSSVNGSNPLRSTVTVAPAFRSRTAVAVTVATMIATGSHLRTSFPIGPPRLNPCQQLFQRLLKNRRLQLVHHGGAVPLGADQLRFLQDGEMPRDCRPRRRKVLRELAGRFRPRP